jgi:putative SOS response-associated peptidase YedK
MPVILVGAQQTAWIASAAAIELLRPTSDNILRMWPVSRRVNSSGNENDARLIEAIH